MLPPIWDGDLQWLRIDFVDRMSRHYQSEQCCSCCRPLPRSRYKLCDLPKYNKIHQSCVSRRNWCFLSSGPSSLSVRQSWRTKEGVQALLIMLIIQKYLKMILIHLKIACLNWFCYGLSYGFSRNGCFHAMEIRQTQHGARFRCFQMARPVEYPNIPTEESKKVERCVKIC